jgi:hypothetical protein
MSLPRWGLESSSQADVLLTRLRPPPPAHVQNLQGCFRVSYRFVEDGRHDYEIKDALEWITLKQQFGSYLIQHYGLMGGEATSGGGSPVEAFGHTITHRAPNKPPSLAATCSGGS